MASLRFTMTTVCLAACCAWASVGLTATLPQDHAYQKQLRAYLATLQEEDFALEEKPFTLARVARTPDEMLRFEIIKNSIYISMSALIRGMRQPAVRFTLQDIESEEGIMVPQVAPDGLCQWATWDYPGNPYYQSRPLKMRAFIVSAVDMIMLDADHERHRRGLRTDYLGGTLIWLAYTYKTTRDLLPPEVSAAYAEGLKKMARRLDAWGPHGLMADMDTFPSVSLRMVADVVKDPAITKLATHYVKHHYTDTNYFHPAGYFVDHGSFDTSYNGLSLYWNTFAALQAPDWPFIRKALDRTYRLKGYLTFPEPDGKAFGPSSMSSRCSACPPHDQWNFPHRNIGGAMLTDHAFFLLPKFPAPEQLQRAEGEMIRLMNKGLTDDKSRPRPARVWVERHWSSALNYTAEFYVDGFYDRWAKLTAANSPLLNNPFQREGDFIEAFEKAFLIGKLGDYAFAIHTAPVGPAFSGPLGPGILGWGGGALCAFWTPKTGSVLLGRSRGMAEEMSLTPDTYWKANTFLDWQSWPVHAVSGMTADGNVFTSGRIRDPHPVYTISRDKKRATVRVKGLIPQDPSNTKAPSLKGKVEYARTFNVNASGVTVSTSIKADGKDRVTELYETLPVFLREEKLQPKMTLPTIHFQVGGAWQDGTTELREEVQAIKVTRFDGAILITFAKPARVKLSPDVWSDYYQSQAKCRTILVDLLNGDGTAKPIPAVSVTYTIAPVRE